MRDPVATLRQVLVQYNRAMHELGWTMVSVKPEDLVDQLADEREKMLDVLLNAQGCRTCDMCPDCGHLAHGAAKDIGHYDDCEIAEVIDLCR